MSDRHSYRGVIYLLLATTTLGAAGALMGGAQLENPLLFETAIALALSAGVLLGISLARPSRPPAPSDADNAVSPSTPPSDNAAEGGSPSAGLFAAVISTRLRSWVAGAKARAQQWRQDLTAMDFVRIGTGLGGLLAVLLVLGRDFPDASPLPLTAGIAATLTLAAAGLAATAVGYLADLNLAAFPEAPFLCRGARVVAWILMLAAASIGLAYIGQPIVIRLLHFLVLAVVTAVAISLVLAKPQRSGTEELFPLDFGVLSLLGGRVNVLASVLDSAEQQLGIDLRSSWALTIVRHGLEPLVAALCVLGWLSTSLTVVGVEEQALVERLGVASVAPALPPGLRVHWPWPIDRVFRIPVRRVQVVHVGHEGEEEGGPEDVLWARQHAANEYTLLLGDGRDLVTIDAAVQFRIVDPRAWHYLSQNPSEALKAIAYRAVMRSTVNLTLSQALSQNMMALTRSMGSMVQKDANDLGLGVEVIGFTVGGMHPPVPVAAAYQAVGSSELGKVTAVLNANVFRNRNVPFAQAAVYASLNTARAEAATALARAAGEATAFQMLDAQFRAASQDYMFSRRLEALEKGLNGRRFTVVDNRFERDGGILWLTP